MKVYWYNISEGIAKNNSDTDNKSLDDRFKKKKNKIIKHSFKALYQNPDDQVHKLVLQRSLKQIDTVIKIALNKLSNYG